MKEFAHQYDVTFSDIDQNFDLPINAVLGIFTDAIARLMASAGIGPADLHRMGYLWVITEFSSRLSGRMPKWSETFTVATKVVKLSAVRVYVDYSMVNSSGDIFAAGSSVWVVMDKEARRPVRCSVLEPLESLLDGEHAGTPDVGRFAGEGEEICCCRHLITNMDTDFNGHMNNQSYAKLALSMAPVQFTASHVISDFHIRFGHESFLGDSLVSLLRKIGEGLFSVIINRESDGSEVCRIESTWNEKIHNS